MIMYVSLISGILLPLLQLLIIHRYFSILLGQNCKTISSSVSWLLYYIFLVLTELTSIIQPQVLLLGNIAFLFFICKFIRKAKLMQSCLITFFICTVWMLVEVIVLLVLQGMNISADIIDDAGSFISKLCMLLFSVILRRYAKATKYSEIPLHYFLATLFVPIGSIYMMHNIFLISSHEKYTLFSIISGILLLSLNYVIFTVFDKIETTSYLKLLNRSYTQQLELCKRQSEERENHYLELRRLRHDIKNHLIGILGMINNNDNERASEYIQSLLNSSIGSNDNALSKTGNIFIDSIINYKHTIALKNNIQFDARIIIPSELSYRSEHLTIILGNLLDNALESCLNEPEESRYIIIEITYVKQVLHICIKNSCTTRLRKSINGHYSTTKKDSYLHGLGISSVEQALSLYNGELILEHDSNEFRAYAILYETSL